MSPLQVSWFSSSIKSADRERPINALVRRAALNIHGAEVAIRFIETAHAQAIRGDRVRLKRIVKVAMRSLERARMYYAAARQLDGLQHTWTGLEKRYAAVIKELQK